MAEYETVTLGRAKRSTAGNRMQALLEQAHQEDDDELFAEVEDDEDFVAPQDARDIFLDEFADTDDEAAPSDEDEDQAIQREERRKAKGKNKAYNPLAPAASSSKTKLPHKEARFAEPSAAVTAKAVADIALLDPSIDASAMAPSSLVLYVRKLKREAKVVQFRSEARRSNLRASTLKTEEELREREKQEKLNPSRKGRRAQHETGEVRGLRPMTQDELIAAALEQEEMNKASLYDWEKREEEKRELRRVGRKRVKGPRWTFVSRTANTFVEVIDEGEGKTSTRVVEKAQALVREVSPSPAPDGAAEGEGKKGGASEAGPSKLPAQANASALAVPPAAADTPPAPAAASLDGTAPTITAPAPSTDSTPGATLPTPTTVATAPGPSSTDAPISTPTPVPNTATTDATAAAPAAIPAPSTPDENITKYTRNYLILSNVPGGLPAELQLVLGDHVAWDEIKQIPSRNRPINRRPPTCPFTGLPAKYRHPTTMIPYATVSAYKEIEALLQERYTWDPEGGCWLGGEMDVAAEGVQGLPGWEEAVNLGWIAGVELGKEVGAAAVEEGPLREELEVVEDVEEEALVNPARKKKRGRANKGRSADTGEPTEGEMGTVDEPPSKKAKTKGKGKRR
ncbi:hypothetical protein IAT38_003155 [Cryptococcus sp. DSM 104549]